MRIAVVGMCHVHGYAHALGYLLPEAELVSFEVAAARNAGVDADVQDRLGQYDHVFAQYFPAAYGPLSWDSLAARWPRVTRLPTVTFAGYQPDMCYLSAGADQFGSPLGAYHSAIIATAYACGIAWDRVASLFNTLVFRRLGYLDAFGKAEALLLRDLGADGHDGAALLAGWVRRGCFMHTLNHPRGFVLADLARAAAIRAGLVAEATPAPDLPFDYLGADTVWPVYPGIAEPLGLTGVYRFKRAGHSVRPGGNDDTIGLPRFVQESYAFYRMMPPRFLDCEPVARTRPVLERFAG